ncbi:hypothetical protein QY049_33295 [Bradyrhizobium sp. WYCCWR 13022]|nr:hypothetical protein [Bradyrhizobium sp. WYCCWR 13022]MDN4988047.1 hypothetical protein [Bradyrhizobium sp. WYCCWR 13022]
MAERFNATSPGSPPVDGILIMINYEPNPGGSHLSSIKNTVRARLHGDTSCEKTWEDVMTELGTALVEAYRNNIRRYHRLLQTHLTDFERQYIQARLSDYQSAIRTLLEHDFDRGCSRIAVGAPADETTKEAV